MLGVCNVLAYLSAIFIYFMGLCNMTTLIAVLSSAPEGMRIALAFNPSLFTKAPPKGGEIFNDNNKDPASRNTQRPYRLEGLVLRCLKHAPCVVLAVFADTVLRELFTAGSAAASTLSTTDRGQKHEFLVKWLTGVVGILWLSSLPLRCLPLVPFVYTFLMRSPPSQSARASIAPESSPAAGIIVAGGGIGGLVLGACLQELALPFEVR